MPYSLIPKPAVLLLATLLAAAQAQAGPKPQVYIPMDYSYCGYRASEQPIPDIRAVACVADTTGDCTLRIQQAIDRVAALPAGKDGFRGAVCLCAGTFRISAPLRIPASGIVLRGAGRDRTRLLKTGPDRDAAVRIETTRPQQCTAPKDTFRVVSADVPAGATTLTLDRPVAKGTMITLTRPSTKEWIAHLGCAEFGGGISYTGWKPGDIDISWHRQVTAVDGCAVTLDAPITTAISARWGGAYAVVADRSRTLALCGLEDMTIDSEVSQWNPRDEDHCWYGLRAANAEDCWARRLAFAHMAGGAVCLERGSRRWTVEDCVSCSPVSEIGGWRRATYYTRGEQCLFQRCVSHSGIHDFAAGHTAPGPNAFVQCEAGEALGFSGSIGSWAAGLLFDIVDIYGSDIKLTNLQQTQFGTGWNSASSLVWQSTAANIHVDSPDSTSQSSANGCWATFWGNAHWTNCNNHVQPRSLYYDQLARRLGTDSLPVNPRILPRNTTASSSPEIAAARQLAHESLTTPRLTLEAWIDAIVAEQAARGEVKLPKPDAKTRTQAESPAREPQFAVSGGRLTCGGLLVVGSKYDIPWWAGRTKDSFMPQAKPAVTRFVPGLDGTGGTDCLDSVVTFLDRGHYAALDHNYGLWYDLRRTDHERVQRADGDVWAPFYEQPFARSGQGRAWDGLSRYDLTRPNRWYWMRLRSFARKAAQKGILLFHQCYFQHNILEAGAHWVDCPWRPVNNINGTDFPEPVPFTGDKRIFMAEQFYNCADTCLRPLHQMYIRQCLSALADCPNAVQLLSAEYTGPLHFTRFWLQTIKAYRAEAAAAGCGKPAFLTALSCTKDAQDSILADPALAPEVDIIDIRYWHPNDTGLWAPKAGCNLAPRQLMRKMKVGKTTDTMVYHAVRDYTRRYPQKAVTFFAQQYPDYGWAILMAGGSMPNIPRISDAFLRAAALMPVIDRTDDDYWMIGSPQTGYVICANAETDIPLPAGKYRLWQVDPKSGSLTRLPKAKAALPKASGRRVYWLEATARN